MHMHISNTLILATSFPVIYINHINLEQQRWLLITLERVLCGSHLSLTSPCFCHFLEAPELGQLS